MYFREMCGKIKAVPDRIVKSTDCFVKGGIHVQDKTGQDQERTLPVGIRTGTVHGIGIAV